MLSTRGSVPIGQMPNNSNFWEDIIQLIIFKPVAKWIPEIDTECQVTPAFQVCKTYRVPITLRTVYVCPGLSFMCFWLVPMITGWALAFSKVATVISSVLSNMKGYNEHTCCGLVNNGLIHSRKASKHGQTSRCGSACNFAFLEPVSSHSHCCHIKSPRPPVSFRTCLGQ